MTAPTEGTRLSHTARKDAAALRRLAADCDRLHFPDLAEQYRTAARNTEVRDLERQKR